MVARPCLPKFSHSRTVVILDGESAHDTIHDLTIKTERDRFKFVFQGGGRDMAEHIYEFPKNER
jgi:hypothetical protein